MAFSKEAQQKRLDEVTAKVAKIREKSDPLRLKRDKHVQAARKREDEMNAEIKRVEKDLFDLEQERAFLSRALGARVLTPEQPEA
jgi:predicted  nucleic acid-binding Zn-ribbon protein